ncbi:MAG: peptidoglycan bridge formation glycyltransferase FemA/FemB family protein [Gammaproteobacteria bacterium]|nr:peptidoglycan bridge formation glycyltransferase FemA/FemB family protein [Gammaproteobacteria bacterium]
MIKNNTIYISFATYENKPISGVIIVTHGIGCSYLLGWNGEVGRQLNAHNFLLWHAIKDAKNRGEVFFDLGGILSNIKYKGIANFKSGLNGEKYALIGEFF